MPSATAKIGGSTTKLSSFTWRRCPTSVAAAQASVIAPCPDGNGSLLLALLEPIWVNRDLPGLDPIGSVAQR
jgi:hypothetical protein